MTCPDRLRLLDVINGVAEDAGVKSHLGSCAACKAEYESMMAATEALAHTAPARPAGVCPTEQLLAAYLHRALPPESETDVEAHLAECSSCLDDLVRAEEAIEKDESGVVPADFVAKIRAINTPSTRERAIRTQRSASRVTKAYRRPSMPVWPFAAAAAVILAVVVIVLANNSGGPSDVVRKPEPKPEKREPQPEPEVTKHVPDLPKPEPPKTTKPEPEPPRPEPKPEPEPEPPKPEPRPEPKPEPKPEPPKPEPKPEPPKPKPETQPEPPTKTEKKFLPAEVASVRGRMTLDGRAVAGSARVSKDGVLATDGRYAACFEIRDEATVFMRPNTQLRIEKLETGDVAIVLDRGEAAFAVEKRATPFVVRSPHADAAVLGTKFDVEIEGRMTTLTVLQGRIEFRNEKGSVEVGANQKCTVTAGERPRQPIATVSATAFEWTKRPELAAEHKNPWMESVAGGKKLPGLVISGPYATWETDAGKFARMLADSMDAGLFVGYFHRDKNERKIWINIDRGTEGAVKDDGSLGAATATDRAKKYYEEYLAAVRAAGGVGPRAPLNMIVTIRNHSEKVQGGGELAVCEVAWYGWNKRTIEQARTLYEQLLDKHKPAKRIEFRWDELDDSYTHKGQTIKFKFTEGDAKTSGWMTTPVCKKGAAFFLPPSWDPDDAYVKIFAELVEFLYQR